MLDPYRNRYSPRVRVPVEELPFRLFHPKAYAILAREPVSDKIHNLRAICFPIGDT